MLRQIIMPDNNSVTLQLPDDLVGKTVEIIAFEIEGQNQEKITLAQKTV